SIVLTGTYAGTNYPASAQFFGQTDVNGALLKSDFYNTVVSVTDGTSNTIMFSEGYMNCSSGRLSWGELNMSPSHPSFVNTGRSGVVGAGSKFQVRPSSSACSHTLTQSLWDSGIHVALADGSVRVVSSSITGTAWWYAITPQGGEALPSE